MQRRKFSREFKLEAVRLVKVRGVAVAQACRDLDKIGGQFMATNADTPLVRELYRGFQVRPIIQGVSVNVDVAGRGKISDLVITNY